MSDMPKQIWAVVWNYGGHHRGHGKREWTPTKPKPIAVERIIPAKTRWWQPAKVEVVSIPQEFTEYVRADLCITRAEANALALAGYTEEQLLAELVRRNKVVSAPLSRTTRDKEIIVGIGKNNSVTIEFFNDDLIALAALQGGSRD